MRYIPNTEEQKKEMLEAIGVGAFEDIIKSIPEKVRVKGELNIPPALSESELFEKIFGTSKKNIDFLSMKPLIGGGAYRHYVPEVVKTVLSYPEFYTAYTPYQPELSQGTLQTMFEVQTHLARLTGMDVVIPSMYDGASAAAETVLMAMRLTHKNKVVISSLVHPHYIETIRTYTEPHGLEIVEVAFENMLYSSAIHAPFQWITDFTELEKAIDDKTAAVIIQSPNFFGGIEDIERISQIAHTKGTMLIQVVVESMSLGILKSPGKLGADIVAGESQSFGMDLNFGGPYNGYIATKQSFIRQLPGRIAGETVDRDGKRAFVMTMRAREQDIRREKATSNICSNHALNLFAIDAYLSLLGANGLYEVASLNARASHYLMKQLVKTGKFEGYAYPFFNEFILKTSMDIESLSDKLVQNGFIPPLRVNKFMPALERHLLFTVTEVLSKQDLDRVVEIAAGER